VVEEKSDGAENKNIQAGNERENYSEDNQPEVGAVRPLNERTTLALRITN
jgi:hypothetical protein